MRELLDVLARSATSDVGATAALHGVVLEQFQRDARVYSDVLEPSFSCDPEGAHLHRFSYAFPSFRADPDGVSRILLRMCRPFGEAALSACRAVVRAARTPPVAQPLFGFADDGGGRFRTKLYLQLRPGEERGGLHLVERMLGRSLAAVDAPGPLHLVCFDVGQRGLVGAKLYFVRDRLRVDDPSPLGPIPLVAALAELGVSELRYVLAIHRFAGPDDGGGARPTEVDFSLPENDLRWDDLRQVLPVRTLLTRSPEVGHLEQGFRLAVRRVSGSIGDGRKLNVYYGLAGGVTGTSTP
jgi:hypothetical protein